MTGFAAFCASAGLDNFYGLGGVSEWDRCCRALAWAGKPVLAQGIGARQAIDPKGPQRWSAVEVQTQAKREKEMKGWVALLLLASLTGCGRISEYTSPSPRDLLAHARWFDGRDVGVCGNVRHGRDSCTLEICADGSDTCANPVSAWLSTKSDCYAGESEMVDKAMVSGRFLDLSHARPKRGIPGYVIAGADVAFVASCGAARRKPAPAGAKP